MSKKRIFVKIEGTDQSIPIAWYTGTPLGNIVAQIKQVFAMYSSCYLRPLVYNSAKILTQLAI